MIAKKYILPKVLQEHGLQKGSITFDDETIRKIIKCWCYHESGVRQLKRCFEKIARKHALEIINKYNVDYKISLDAQELPADSITIELDNKVKEKEKEKEGATTTQELFINNSIKSENIIVEQEDRTIKIINSVNKELSEEEDKNINSQIKQEVNILSEFKNQQRLIFDANKDTFGKNLKQYLGLPVWDSMAERKYRKNYIGNLYLKEFHVLKLNQIKVW